MGKKDVKELLEVTWASHVFGMELHAKERLRAVHNALIRLVILVGKQWRPLSWQTLGIHSIAVVLCRDVAPLRSDVRARLIVTAIAVPTSDQCECKVHVTMTTINAIMSDGLCAK